jgi:hypothetical protein
MQRKAEVLCAMTADAFIVSILFGGDGLYLNYIGFSHLMQENREDFSKDKDITVDDTRYVSSTVIS